MFVCFSVRAEQKTKQTELRKQNGQPEEAVDVDVDVERSEESLTQDETEENGEEGTSQTDVASTTEARGKRSHQASTTGTATRKRKIHYHHFNEDDEGSD